MKFRCSSLMVLFALTAALSSVSSGSQDHPSSTMGPLTSSESYYPKQDTDLHCAGIYRYNTTSFVMTSMVNCSGLALDNSPNNFTIDYALYRDADINATLNGTLGYKLLTPVDTRYQLYTSSDLSLPNATFICGASKFAIRSLGWRFENGILIDASIDKNVDCSKSQMTPFAQVAQKTAEKLIERDSTTPVYRALPNLGSPNNFQTARRLTAGSTFTNTDYFNYAAIIDYNYYFYSNSDYMSVTMRSSSSLLNTGYLNEYGGGNSLIYTGLIHNDYIETQFICQDHYDTCDFQTGYNYDSFFEVYSLSTSSSSTYSDTCPNGVAAVKSGSSLICCGPSTVNQYSAGTNYYICVDLTTPYLQYGPSQSTTYSASTTSSAVTPPTAQRIMAIPAGVYNEIGSITCYRISSPLTQCDEMCSTTFNAALFTGGNNSITFPQTVGSCNCSLGAGGQLKFINGRYESGDIAIGSFGSNYCIVFGDASSGCFAQYALYTAPLMTIQPITATTAPAIVTVAVVPPVTSTKAPSSAQDIFSYGSFIALLSAMLVL